RNLWIKSVLRESSVSLWFNRHYFFANCASNASSLGLKSRRLVKAQASAAPCSRSMPLSSHSMERGPWYPTELSARMISSKLIEPWPRERKSQYRSGLPKSTCPPNTPTLLGVDDQ